MRLLYVALTRPRDHLVVSLFRATKGEETDAGRLDALFRGREDVEVLDEMRQGAAAPRPRDQADGTTPEEQKSAEEAWIARRAVIVARRASMVGRRITELVAETRVRPEC